MRPQHDKVMAVLERRYAEPAASSKETPWEVLLFTALTARSRDEQVEPVFRRLMARYPGPAQLAKAKVKDVEAVLRTVGLYRSKARNAVALARTLMERHGGIVPADLAALVALPAVGRKTASCTLVYAFGVPAIAVDTHVHRVTNRLGWVTEGTPEKTERALRATLPERHWLDINRVMVQFGRDVCVPGRPKCWKCPVATWCAYPDKIPAPKDAGRGRLTKVKR
ncbi:MAG TPA: endonuclease III [Candidatus Eisenbacteria bacterium]|nr:endonuclease III [Candidatus Eisenbacteria bacterium]